MQRRKQFPHDDSITSRGQAENESARAAGEEEGTAQQSHYACVCEWEKGNAPV